MAHFKIEFAEHAAVEGDGWTSKPLPRCSRCGQNYIPGAAFLTPDDRVDRVVAFVPDYVDDELLPVSSVLLARTDFADALVEEQFTGFAVRPALVEYAEQASRQPLPGYSHLHIHGRCAVAPIWDRLVSPCETCGTFRREQVTQSTRRVLLQSQPNVDFARSHEPSAGIIVSERLVAFCSAFPFFARRITFTSLHVAPAA